MCDEWVPETFSNQFLSQQQLHSRYILQLLLETWKQLRMLPNINRISTCHSKEITICGELQEGFRNGGCGFYISQKIACKRAWHIKLGRERMGGMLFSSSEVKLECSLFSCLYFER